MLKFAALDSSAGVGIDPGGRRRRRDAALRLSGDVHQTFRPLPPAHRSPERPPVDRLVSIFPSQFHTRIHNPRRAATHSAPQLLMVTLPRGHLIINTLYSKQSSCSSAALFTLFSGFPRRHHAVDAKLNALQRIRRNHLPKSCRKNDPNAVNNRAAEHRSQKVRKHDFRRFRYSEQHADDTRIPLACYDFPRKFHIDVINSRWNGVELTLEL